MGHALFDPQFFSMINETMADDILLIMAKRDGDYIAGALNFIGGDTLFGRNWGVLKTIRFCISSCAITKPLISPLKRGLKRVEAGAQGTHKLARGYVPHRTYSAHYIAHAGLREAVGNYLESERQYVDNDIAVLSNHTPFRKTANEGEDHDQT